MCNIVCDPDMCTGCKACVEVCSQDAIEIIDSLKNNAAMINPAKCISCGRCKRACQVHKRPTLCKPKDWFQGWTKDEEERKKSSSGGIAYSLLKQIILEKGTGVSCKFEAGRFIYSIINEVSDLDVFRESKYVKSDPDGIYSEVEKKLNNGSELIFIGLPCHVAALKNYLGIDYENLITIDLVCHGTPSPGLLELFLEQYGYCLSSIKNIHFRNNEKYRVTIDDVTQQSISFTQPTIRDRYSLAFLYGLTFTENCYRCPYAGLERVSDITLGDSWGSTLGNIEIGKGISLVLCQTRKGLNLLQRAPVELFEVELEKAKSFNHQLREPFPMPNNRKTFFEKIENGSNFNKAVEKCFPKACLRLDIKNYLLRLGIKKYNW